MSNCLGILRLKWYESFDSSTRSLHYPISTPFSCLLPTLPPSSLQLSSQEGSGNQDEIDFEFLGAKKDMVQLNVWVNGQMYPGSEVVVPLGFDCSQDFHTYAIYYTDNQIVYVEPTRCMAVGGKLTQSKGCVRAILPQCGIKLIPQWGVPTLESIPLCFVCFRPLVPAAGRWMVTSSAS